MSELMLPKLEVEGIASFVLEGVCEKLDIDREAIFAEMYSALDVYVNVERDISYLEDNPNIPLEGALRYIQDYFEQGAGRSLDEADRSALLMFFQKDKDAFVNEGLAYLKECEFEEALKDAAHDAYRDIEEDVARGAYVDSEMDVPLKIADALLDRNSIGACIEGGLMAYMEGTSGDALNPNDAAQSILAFLTGHSEELSVAGDYVDVGAVLEEHGFVQRVVESMNKALGLGEKEEAVLSQGPVIPFRVHY